MTTSEKPPENWCLEFFDDLFADQYLTRPKDRYLPQTISFLTDLLKLKQGDTLFDQCCGTGDVSHAMAENNIKTIGVDLIPSYIKRAQENTHDLDCVFHIGDAHKFVTDQKCDAAVNWWTSFGYTDDDKQNIKMLQCLFDSVKSGGYVALDYMNAPQRLNDFKDTDTLYSTHENAGHTSSWESKLSDDKKMIIKKWICTKPDGTTIEKQGGGAKLYTKAELQDMFEACGFINITFYGGLDKSSLTDNSPRCVTVAQRP